MCLESISVVPRRFALSFKNTGNQISHTRVYLLVEKKTKMNEIARELVSKLMIIRYFHINTWHNLIYIIYIPPLSTRVNSAFRAFRLVIKQGGY